MSILQYSPGPLARLALVLACGGAVFAALPARAQSEASVGLSMLPVASVVGTASVAGAAASTVAAVPVALLASGALLTVKAVEVSARGTVIVLERASDGAQASIALAGGVAGASAFAVGASVTTTVIASGVILSAAGEVLCFIPNAIGQALLYNERVR